MQVLFDGYRASTPRPPSEAFPWRFEASEGALMSNNLYVGNLTFDTSNADLESLFATHGEVSKAQVITDRDSGRSRGFGFVEMATAEGRSSCDRCP